jgi:hypothetical protein
MKVKVGYTRNKTKNKSTLICYNQATEVRLLTDGKDWRKWNED